MAGLLIIGGVEVDFAIAFIAWFITKDAEGYKWISALFGALVVLAAINSALDVIVFLTQWGSPQ